MWDWILYAIIAAFIAWEAVAHYLLGNRAGHTLSNRIAWLEDQGSASQQTAVRVVVAAAVAALGVHLEGGF